MNEITMSAEWLTTPVDTFWGKTARHEHAIQIYENDDILTNTLTGFMQGIINSNENAVVIATHQHLTALESRLEKLGFKVDELISNDRFIPFDAEEMIDECMIDDEFDETVFAERCGSLIKRATDNKKTFMTCGEIAPLLITQGKKEAAIKLEQLSDKMCSIHHSGLFCIYSKNHLDNSYLHEAICSCHAKLVSGTEKQLTEVFYQNIR
jgi:MEDS: MEthanogen/methylotroph, DcmR Sensory domain